MVGVGGGCFRLREVHAARHPATINRPSLLLPKKKVLCTEAILGELATGGSNRERVGSIPHLTKHGLHNSDKQRNTSM